MAFSTSVQHNRSTELLRLSILMEYKPSLHCTNEVGRYALRNQHATRQRFHRPRSARWWARDENQLEYPSMTNKSLYKTLCMRLSEGFVGRQKNSEEVVSDRRYQKSIAWISREVVPWNREMMNVLRTSRSVLSWFLTWREAFRDDTEDECAGDWNIDIYTVKFDLTFTYKRRYTNESQATIFLAEC